MKNENIFGLLIISALASSSIALGDATTAPAPGADAKGAKAEAPYCQNTCKGKSDCAAHGNASCGGKNTCAGVGFVKKGKNEKTCIKAGGVWSAKKTS